MNPQIKYTNLATGVTVEYVENGTLAGTPLLLLHGLSDSWHSFLPLLPHLPAGLRALAFTQRGHGQSSKPRDDYRLQTLVADALAFLDVMHVDRAVVAGHSMGAAVATLLAAHHPDRVAGLALLGAFADFRGNAGVIELRQDVRTSPTRSIRILRARFRSRRSRGWSMTTSSSWWCPTARRCRRLPGAALSMG